MSRRAARSTRRLALLVTLALAAVLTLALALLAPGVAWAARWVIPPGQEAIAMRMLGGELPAGCRLAGAAIQKTEIVARYTCGGGETRISLRHPEDAPGAVARSKQLAIVVPEGAAPPGELVAALADRLRAEEASWRWIVEGRSLGRSLAAAGLSARTKRLVAPLGAAAALGFAALVLAAVRSAVRGGGAVAGARREGLSRRDAAPAIALVAVVYAYLRLAHGSAPVHADTTRDLLMAAECGAGLPCDHGPPTSLGVIVQGALWTRFVALFLKLGASVAAMQGVVYLLHALSAVVVWAATKRRFGAGVALATGALFAIAGAAWLEVPVLWNPSISPLPLAAVYALSFELAEDDDRGLRSAAVTAGAAWALALAIDSHVLFAVLVPPLFAAIAATARRWGVALGIAAAVLVATLILDARTAWIVNARALADAGAAIPLALLVAAGVAAGAWSRARIASMTPEARALVFTGVAVVSATGVATLLFVGFGSAAAPRYLMPAAPGLALGVALVGGRVARRIAVRAERAVPVGAALVAAVCLAMWLGTPRVGSESGFTIAELEVTARAVYQRMPSHRDVVAHVHGRSSADVAAFAIFEPRVRARADGQDDWVLLKRSRAGTPPPGPRLVTVDLGRDVAVLAAVTPRLDRSRTTFCFAPRSGVSEEQGCVDARFGRDPAGPTTSEERAYPALAAVRDAFPAEMLARFGGGVRETIRIAFEGGPPHVVALMNPRSGYRIDGVTGAKARGELPAMRVVIEDGAGELVLAREDGGEPRADRTWPPEVVEAPEGDVALVGMVEEAMRR